MTHINNYNILLKKSGITTTKDAWKNMNAPIMASLLATITTMLISMPTILLLGTNTKYMPLHAPSRDSFKIFMIASYGLPIAIGVIFSFIYLMHSKKAANLNSKLTKSNAQLPESQPKYKSGYIRSYNLEDALYHDIKEIKKKKFTGTVAIIEAFVLLPLITISLLWPVTAAIYENMYARYNPAASKLFSVLKISGIILASSVVLALICECIRATSISHKLQIEERDFDKIVEQAKAEQTKQADEKEKWKKPECIEVCVRNHATKLTFSIDYDEKDITAAPQLKVKQYDSNAYSNLYYPPHYSSMENIRIERISLAKTPTSNNELLPSTS